jgi:hypothetical protein
MKACFKTIRCPVKGNTSIKIKILIMGTLNKIKNMEMDNIPVQMVKF